MITTPLEHHRLTTNGITLHVVQAGPLDGPVALLLHGYPEAWFAWAGQIDALVARGYRVWLPDQRGYNLSDKPAGAKAYRIETLVADMLGLIAQTGRVDVALFGHDWGGAVAWELANRHPERIATLVIANMPHPLVMRQHLQSSLRQLRMSWYIFYYQLRWLPEWRASRNEFRKLSDALRNSSAAGTFSDAALERYRTAWRQPGALTGMLNWYRNVLSPPAKSTASPRIRVPTLLIWGRRDHALDSAMAQPTIALCDQGRLAWIDDAGHWVLHEQGAQVAGLIAQFLEQQTPVCV